MEEEDITSHNQKMEELQLVLESVKIQSKQVNKEFRGLRKQILQYLVVFTKGSAGKLIEYLEIFIDFTLSTILAVGLVFVSNVSARFLESQNLIDSAKVLVRFFELAEKVTIVSYITYLTTIMVINFAKLAIIKVMTTKAEIGRISKDDSKNT